MGAVASFVSDVVESVGDFVGDVVETVGDVVENVVDVVGDVVEKVGDTVQAVIENPLPTLVAVAGQFVGIPAPLTMAALTAAQGGSIEDIVLSAGTAYFAPTVVSSLSETFAPALLEAVGNETVANVVADSTSKALVNGTIAEVKGGDFEDGFAGAFTGSIVNSSVGEFTNEFVKPDVLAAAEENGIDLKTANQFLTGATRAISSGITAEVTGRGDFATAFTNSVTNQTVNAGTNYATNSIGDQFKSVGEGWGVAKEEDKEGFETTITTDATGAGIPDDLVNQVEVANTGTDSGDSTTTLANNIPTGSLGDLSGAPNAEDADTLAADLNVDTTEPTSSVTVYGLPADYQYDDTSTASTIPSSEETGETVADNETDETLAGDSMAYLNDLIAKAPSTSGKPVVGGLSAVIPEGENVTEEDVSFYGGKPTAVTEDSVIDTVAEDKSKMPQDILASMNDIGITPMGDEKPVDIAGSDEKPAGGGLSSLVDTRNITPAAIGAGVLKQVINPAIKSGLTKALTRSTPRPTAPKTARVAPAKQLSGAQLAAARSKGTAAPATKAVPMTRTAQYAPPKKVDVSKLTPITNISGLTSMLAKNKGQG